MFFALHKNWATKWQSRQPVAIFAVTYLLLPHGLKKEPTFRDATTGFPAKWRLRNEGRNPILNDDVPLPTSGYCFWLDDANLQPLRSTNHNCVLTRHQYGIFALVSQTSFHRQTSGVVAKCQLFVFSGYYPFRNKVHAYHKSTTKRNVFGGLKSQTWLSTHCPL